MNPFDTPAAFGAPGIEPRWTSSAKEGVGTAYHTSCRLWFTLSHGIINEIYYPHVDQPNTRDFQFLITDGETFCHEEKRDLEHLIEYPERDCVFYRLTNSERQGRYRLIKHVLTDPHRSVLLMHTRLEVLDESLVGKLRLYALLAPHIARYGAGNSGWCSEIGASRLLHAQREGVHLVMACTAGFSRRSVGYVGASDGWQDMMGNFKMDWEFRVAERGNIALTGEIALPENDFMIAIACGGSYQSTAAKLLQSLAEPFETHRAKYVSQWQRAVVNPRFDFSRDTGDDGGMYRLSRCILLAHEDKIFQGALVASMSIPWGETKGKMKRGGATGAAMPLCWSHAEYVSLVRSRHDGVCFDRIEPAYQRYVLNPVQSHHEIWSLRHPLRRVPWGKILRIILGAEATVVWSVDGWVGTNNTETTHESGLDLWFADFPTGEWPAGSVFTFSCFWKRDQRWPGRNWQVTIL